MKHIAIICFIADPFDPPGYERFGGGHLFLFELGRFLVKNGFYVTYITRLNSPTKNEFEQLGPKCKIFRIKTGPLKEIQPDETGKYLLKLYNITYKTIQNIVPCVEIIHSHYWIAGEVSRRISKKLKLKHFHSILSLGRIKKQLNETLSSVYDLRIRCELKIYNSADYLIAVCPSEKSDLLNLYPEIKNKKNIKIIPYGVNSDVFFPKPESSDNYICWATNRFKKGIDIIF